MVSKVVAILPQSLFLIAAISEQPVKQGVGKESDMSVPGRIGIVLLVILGLIDAAILLSGARQAAATMETGALASRVQPVKAVLHDHPVSDIIRDIELLAFKSSEDSKGI